MIKSWRITYAEGNTNRDFHNEEIVPKESFFFSLSHFYCFFGDYNIYFFPSFFLFFFAVSLGFLVSAPRTAALLASGESPLDCQVPRLNGQALCVLVRVKTNHSLQKIYSGARGLCTSGTLSHFTPWIYRTESSMTPSL